MRPPAARPMRSTDRDAVLALKVRVFEGCDLAAERRRWRWQFEANPAAGAAPLGTVIETAGAIVGSFAFVPLRVQIGARVGLALDGIDLCVAPEHRGQGLGHALNETLWRAGVCDFPFATGVNAASHRLFSSGGARLLGGAGEQTGFAYFVHDRHPPFERPTLDTRVVDSLGAEADQLWRALRAEWRLGLVRDAAYLNWRYRDHPFQRPLLLVVAGAAPRGVAVLQEDPVLGRWYLLELLTGRTDTEARRALLAAVHRAVAGSPHEAVYYATRDGHQRACLAAADFRPVPGDVPTFMGKLHPNREEEDVKVTDWCVSLGDGDQLYGVGAGADA